MGMWERVPTPKLHVEGMWVKVLASEMHAESMQQKGAQAPELHVGGGKHSAGVV